MGNGRVSLSKVTVQSIRRVLYIQGRGRGRFRSDTCIESEETNVAWESILSTANFMTNFRLVSSL